MKSYYNNFLLYTSLLFITNAITAHYNNYNLYSLFFMLLTTTSLIYHTKNSLIHNLLDKCSILSIVIYGAYLTYIKKDNNIFLLLCIIISFLSTVFLYSYGYLTKKYCFDKNKYIGNLYHSFLHIISCIGHHLIIFL
jgi:hypothetical protein